MLDLWGSRALKGAFQRALDCLSGTLTLWRDPCIVITVNWPCCTPYIGTILHLCIGPQAIVAAKKNLSGAIRTPDVQMTL